MRVRDFSRPTTLNPDRLFGQVAQKLAVAIITGRVRAGEVLPNEEALRSEISVSRTAYHEAVKILTAKGLVEARPKSGTRAAPRERWNLLDPDVLSWHFEADPNEKFIRDLFELRRFVEPSAARLAAQRRTAADIARIEAAYRGMVAGRPYAEATIRADLAFHEAIFAAPPRTRRCIASPARSSPPCNGRCCSRRATRRPMSRPCPTMSMSSSPSSTATAISPRPAWPPSSSTA
ncbi:GntR family transcriptional regulator [Bosea sp. (in: a-proteobacteria)]|uniref:FadR/GntR family transcriptional regulator n=1 Tax=Bosea sp. (in: a-proteobacteria) TaxID=1871050 RepID=UPI00260E37F8|nr:GntR family transcriptional regulator [Bosea sp. (in: a-proteobacteria)]MCO5090764.1 GntR family transcriptional regulator [Bosea sp. (in: a-proteobacteria)]